MKGVELRKVSDSLNSAQEAFATLDQKSAIQTEVVGRVEEKVKRCTSEKDRARMLNHITDLRGQLDDNQPCPVCGAMEHPWREKKEGEREKQLKIASAQVYRRLKRNFKLKKGNSKIWNRNRFGFEENRIVCLRSKLDESRKKS